MKIVIAGGLGYDGAGLIEAYRQEIEHEIILLDKRFVPHLLVNLPPHMHYVHGDIQDEPLMKRLLDGADLAYLLAAEVEAEKSIDKKKAIWDNNYHGAMTFINSCSDQCRIFFASSGNLFGGVRPEEKNIDLNEEDTPQPKLPYAESKRAVEEFLFKTDKNYTIVRFGTHFGYTPGIRFNLVTNIFFRKAMMGHNLTVHGTGDNYRPTLCAKDAVRGMRYLAELPDASRQIYHLIGENYRIRDLARAVASVFPGVQVEHIDKEVPFNSYHLSNEKVKASGFKFEWTIPQAMEEMRDIFRSVENRKAFAPTP